MLNLGIIIDIFIDKIKKSGLNIMTRLLLRLVNNKYWNYLMVMVYLLKMHIILFTYHNNI